MRILCVSAQLPGHLDWGGYLATAAELARRGHDLLWVSGLAVADSVTRAGVPFHGVFETGWRWPPPPPLTSESNATEVEMQQQRQMRALDQWLDVERVTQAGEELGSIVELFRPDLILSEMFIAASGLVAEARNIPFVVMGWPAPLAQSVPGSDVMAAIARKRLDELIARFQISGANWTGTGPPALSSPLLHITYWSPSWFAGMGVGPQTVHVGGLRPPLHPPSMPRDPSLSTTTLPSPEDAPWILITLGTSFNVDPNFFIAAAHAVDQMGCLPLLAIGAPLSAEWVQTMQQRLPTSAVVRSHLDFGVVLPHVAAAIHHGGAGTTHALVRHAVPQSIVPHAADQMRQAQGLMRSQSGLYIPAKEVTIPRLVETLSQLLPDRSPLRGHAIALQAEFDALGGVPAAADQIERIKPIE